MKVFRPVVLIAFALLSELQLLAAAPAPKLPKPQQAAYMAAFEQYVVRTYVGAKLAESGLSVQALRNALIGYYSLRGQGLAKQPILTVIDFGRASRHNRLWVIDLERSRLLHHTLVAHGKNTGEDMARTFSNRAGSEMSSLGFYLTGQTYQGKHGLSLRLTGLDPSYNSKAAERAVVVHGADYVSHDFIRQHGRLGRSQGCPALPTAQSASIIKTIKGGSVLYIQGPDAAAYSSNWLSIDNALPGFARMQGVSPLLGQVGQ